MRVLQIVNYYYPHIGGIEKVAEDIAGVLKERGHEQKIICFNEPEGTQGKFSKTVVEDDDGTEVTR